MHILIIPSELYLPPGNNLSGIFQQHHANLLSDYSETVGVISSGFVPFRELFSTYEYLPYENVDNINIYRDFFRVPLPGRLSLKLFKNLLISRYYNLFKKYIKLHGMPDIVHAHNCLYAGLAGALIKSRHDIPLVITEHSSLYERKLLSPTQLADTNHVLKSADVVTVVSSFLGESLAEATDFRELRFKPIFNVLDSEVSDSYRRTTTPREKFIFLSIGSLDDNKNHQLLLNAFALRFVGNKSYGIRIAGDGPNRKMLGDLAVQLGIADQVFFCGQLGRKQIVEEFSKSNVVVTTSNVETFGVVLIEALSFGLPVISTDCGGPREIVIPENGYIVEKNNVVELSKYLGEMSENYARFDSDFIRAECIGRFGTAAFYDRLKNIYFEIGLNE